MSGVGAFLPMAKRKLDEEQTIAEERASKRVERAQGAQQIADGRASTSKKQRDDYGKYKTKQNQAAKARKAYEKATETISLQYCEDVVKLQRDVKPDDVVPMWFIKPEQHQMLGHLARDWAFKLSL